MDEVITVGDAVSLRGRQASTFSMSPPSSSSLFLPNNLPLISAFLAFALAQFLKIFTTWSVRLIISNFWVIFSYLIITSLLLWCFRIFCLDNFFFWLCLSYGAIFLSNVLCIWFDSRFGYVYETILFWFLIRYSWNWNCWNFRKENRIKDWDQIICVN